MNFWSVGAVINGSTKHPACPAGITQLTVLISPKRASFPLNTLLFWLLCNNTSFEYGVAIHRNSPVDLRESLLAACLRPAAARLLVHLDLTTDASIWQNLFELTALQDLTMKVVPEPEAAPIDISALQPSLPNLHVLSLRSCTASLAPLLTAATLPKLATVELTSCQPPDDIDLSNIARSSTIQSLIITNCSKLQVIRRFHSFGL